MFNCPLVIERETGGGGETKKASITLEGQPNVNFWAWLVIISGGRCKRPCTQHWPWSPPEKAGHMMLWQQNKTTQFPPNLQTPTKKSFSFVFYTPWGAQCRWSTTVPACVWVCNTSPSVDGNELKPGFEWPHFTFECLSLSFFQSVEQKLFVFSLPCDVLK